MVELRESPQGGLSVAQVWCVADCGVLAHQDTVVAQLEGGIVFGLTAALHGRLRIRNGAIQGGFFDDYHLLQLADSPVITVELVRSDWQTLAPSAAGSVTGIVAPAAFLATIIQLADPGLDQRQSGGVDIQAANRWHSVHVATTHARPDKRARRVSRCQQPRVSNSQ